MAISIITPEHQFLRFSDQHLDDADWFDSQLPGHSIGFAVPVAAQDDVAYQFIVSTTTEAEADAICALPMDEIAFKNIYGTSLGPTLTPAAFNSATEVAATAQTLNVERYRISTTEVLFYVPTLSPLGEVCGLCFQVAVNLSTTSTVAAAVSNVFKHICDADYTTVLEYYSAQDEAGFIYCVAPSIKSRVRLPLYLTRPTFPEEETEHRLSGGEITIIKAVVRKVYEVVSDVMPEWALEAFRALWLHDEVYTDEATAVPQTLAYTGEIVKEGAYEIEWPDFLNYPLGKPKLKVSATPFLLKKNNCGECVDYSSLLDVPGAIQQAIDPDTVYIIDLNTYITADCCSPLTTAIDYYQTDKIDSISMGIGTNTLTFHTRATYLLATPPPLVRIKVTCGGIIKYISIEEP